MPGGGEGGMVNTTTMGRWTGWDDGRDGSGSAENSFVYVAQSGHIPGCRPAPRHLCLPVLTKAATENVNLFRTVLFLVLKLLRSNEI